MSLEETEPPRKRNACAIESSQPNKKPRLDADAIEEGEVIEKVSTLLTKKSETEVISLLSSDEDDSDDNQKKPAAKTAVVIVLSSDDDGDEDVATERPQRPSNRSNQPKVKQKKKRPPRNRRRRSSWPVASVASLPSDLAHYGDSIAGDLSHSQKCQHFQDARRPQRLLEAELQQLQSQAVHPDQRQVWQNEISRVQSLLETARRNASQDIYNRNNSSEGLVAQANSRGSMVVDFHGLYVEEAVSKFREMVLPVLPVVKEVVVITGKGIHSRGGKSALQCGLIDHIRTTVEYQSQKLDYGIDKKNTGQIVLTWKCH